MSQEKLPLQYGADFYRPVIPTLFQMSEGQLIERMVSLSNSRAAALKEAQKTDPLIEALPQTFEEKSVRMRLVYLKQMSNPEESVGPSPSEVFCQQTLKIEWIEDATISHQGTQSPENVLVTV